MNKVSNHLLIRQSLIAVGQKDDAAILESVFQDIVLHDVIVAVRVNADVALPVEAKLHDTHILEHNRSPCNFGFHLVNEFVLINKKSQCRIEKST